MFRKIPISFGVFLLWGTTWAQALPTATPMAAFPPAQAPVSTSTAAELQEIVVTAPIGQEVLQGPDLDSIKADSRLADLLDTQGGLETEGLGIAKSFSNVSIRGSGTNQVLVLLNGQRTNQGFDLAMIPTEDIVRVEVIKGPAALAYGPDATGGVINIITRTQGRPGDLGASVGDFGTYQLHGSTGDFNLGPWQGSFSGNGFNTNGYTANTDLVNWELDHSSHLDLGADQLDLTADYVYKNGGSPNGDSLSAFDTGQFDTDDREEKQALDAVVADTRDLDGWKLDPSFAYNYANVLRLNPLGADASAGVPKADQNIYNTFDFLATGSHGWGDWFHSLSLGFEFRSEQVQGTEGLGDGVRTDDVTSLTSQGLWDFTQDLSLRWSGRLDWYNTYHLAEFNPEGTLKYRLSAQNDLYFEAGTGFRYPDFDELYHPRIDYSLLDLPIEFGYGEIGNASLRPEKSVNLEAGAELGGKGFSAKASAFASFYDNLIIAAEVPEDSPVLPVTLNPVPYWSFANVPQARILGFEADLNLALSPWLSPYANYTFADSRGDYSFAGSPNTQPGQLVPGRMRDKLEGGMELDFPGGTQVNVYDQYVDRNPAIYTGPQDLPPVIIASSYSILNADFKTDWGSHSKAFLSFKNILNQQYATIQGLLMPGRYFEVGTTVDF